ncbi:hypothetical protein D7322_24110 [Sphingobacterium puteale]|uniref:DUF4252 domain-containing protein n=1 Tax=Sphingobacterium puteale TaxID=2420510 RepID=A0A420VRX5_9SPHI|nr:hypothetical protein [Sphingobacterium puteale]RKO69064.1 hypothetical protein D7322_24110 [Sphingobacterium puteale]
MKSNIMKICGLLGIVLITIATSHSAFAQSKVDNALNMADGAAETVNKAGKTLKTIGGLFKKKDKKEAESTMAPATTIHVVGLASYDDVDKFKDNIVSCKGVKNANLKFKKDKSTIQVAHAGTTEEFFENLKKTGSLQGKNILSLEEGTIEIEVPAK